MFYVEYNPGGSPVGWVLSSSHKTVEEADEERNKLIRDSIHDNEPDHWRISSDDPMTFIIRSLETFSKIFFIVEATSEDAAWEYIRAHVFKQLPSYKHRSWCEMTIERTTIYRTSVVLAW